MLKLLKAKSLRFWILVGMIIALAPLAMSAGVGYLLLNRGVIAPIHDVAFRQSEQVGPTQHLCILIWDTLIPVDEYVEDAHPAHPKRIDVFVVGPKKNLRSLTRLWPTRLRRPS